jgi:hypothetical protein
MGMFSWKCKGCGEEICSPEIALVKAPNGITWGEYNGYGEVGMYNVQESWPDEPAMWHRVCYDVATPSEQNDITPSDHAPNQGFGEPNPKFM